MTDKQSADTLCVADGMHVHLDDHKERLTAVEKRPDVIYLVQFRD